MGDLELARGHLGALGWQEGLQHVCRVPVGSDTTAEVKPPQSPASAMMILQLLSLPGEFNAWAVSKETSQQTVQAVLHACSLTHM